MTTPPIPKAYLIPGFNVSDRGEDTINRVRPYLESNGWDVTMDHYGWIGLLGAWSGNPSRAKELALRSASNDIAIGHSNGCAIIHRATHFSYGSRETPPAKFKKVIYINPALDVDLAPGPCVEEFHVLYAPDDPWVEIARFIPGSLWGGMGRYGYQGNDCRGANYDLAELMRLPIGHSGVFSKIKQAGSLIQMIAGTPDEEWR